MPILAPVRSGPTPALDGAPSIEVENLVMVYRGGTTALGGVSFTVGPGEIFGLLGPNGSGKSTTVKILVTLLRMTSGTARVGGFPVDRDAAEVRRVIGYAGQSTGIDDDLSVLENLALQGMLHDLSRRHAWGRATELAERFLLSEQRRVRASRLSGGMRRRLDLAVALVHRPSVLFLDEPTTGLDPQSRNALWQELRGLAETGTTVLLTTQYLEEADRACDRVAIIDAGRLVTVGPPPALKEEVGEGRLTLTIPNADDRARAKRAVVSLPMVTRAEDDGSLVAYVRDAASSVAPVLRLLDQQGIEVAAVDQARATLDDVFLRYTGRRPRDEAPASSAVSSIFASVHGGRRHGGTR